MLLKINTVITVIHLKIHTVITVMHSLSDLAKLSSSFNFSDHRFLTGGPWKGSRGSAKIRKVKHCTQLQLFYRN